MGAAVGDGEGEVGPRGWLLAPVGQAVDRVVFDPTGMTDDEVRGAVADAELICTRLRGLQARLVAEANRRDLARRDGWASPAAWLTHHLRVSPAEASRRQDEATAVAVPGVAGAFERGEITPEHARTIVLTTSLEPAMDPGPLLQDARSLDAGRFARHAARLRRAHQADAGLSHYESQRTARRCSIRVRPDDGMVVLHAELDPLAGARVRAVLFSQADRLWRAEQGERTEATVPAEARTNPQRLADALVDVFGRPVGPDRPPEAVQVMVSIDYADLVDQSREASAEVVGVGPIPAATARRLACEAELLPVVLGGRSEVLDLGRGRRLASRAQRRALQHRHGSCAVRGCTVPFEWTQVHHLTPWEQGGRTDLQELVPLCSGHHHLVHEGGRSLGRGADGSFDLLPPVGSDHPGPRCKTAGDVPDRSRSAPGEG